MLYEIVLGVGGVDPIALTVRHWDQLSEEFSDVAIQEGASIKFLDVERVCGEMTTSGTTDQTSLNTNNRPLLIGASNADSDVVSGFFEGSITTMTIYLERL